MADIFAIFWDCVLLPTLSKGIISIFFSDLVTDVIYFFAKETFQYSLLGLSCSESAKLELGVIL